MAAPTIRNTTTTNTAPGTSTLSLALPTYEAGDLLLVWMVSSADRTTTGPSGWTTVELRGANGHYLFKRIADGTEGSSLSVTMSNTVANLGVVAMSVQGAADPDTSATDDADVSGGETSINSPSVTVATNDSLVLRSLWASYHTAPTAPANTTQQGTTGSALNRRLYIYKDDAAASTPNSGTATWGINSSYNYTAGTVVVAPSAATAPTISSVTLSGTSQIGNTLTATVVTDQDPVDSTTYQWEKASDGSGTGAADISGETSSTLALTYADFGDLLDTAAYVRCGAIATKNALPSDEAFSAWQQVTVPSSAGLVSSPLKSPFLIA